MLNPARGGSYAVFDQRPLSSKMQSYCIQDIVYMTGLRELYREKLCDKWWRKIEKETDERMALGPPRWLHWRPSEVQRGSRTLFTCRRDSAGPLDADDRRPPAEWDWNFAMMLESMGFMSVGTSGGAD